jgi:hypothetical protein
MVVNREVQTPSFMVFGGNRYKPPLKFGRVCETRPVGESQAEALTPACRVVPHAVPWPLSPQQFGER